tara:strand:+ start:9269 stop:9898 length:630 start_codon:yes stop_codon:yes gene_type:complete
VLYTVGEKLMSGTRGVKKRNKLINVNAHTKHLNEKQREFAEQLVASPRFSPKEAAEKVGYAHGAVAGSKLLKNEYVNAYVAHLIQCRSEVTELKAESVLKELMFCALRDPIGLVDEEGFFKTNLHEIPEELRRCIDAIKVKQTKTEDENGNESIDQTLEIKFVSKAAMIELAMKHLGLLDSEGQANNEGQNRLDWDKLLEEGNSNIVDI